MILTVVSYSFSSRVCLAEGRLNVQLDLLVSKMAGIKSSFPGSLILYARDVVTTNVTSSKIPVFSPFLEIMKGHSLFFFVYRRMRFLILVGLGKKKPKKKITRSLGLTKCTEYTVKNVHVFVPVFLYAVTMLIFQIKRRSDDGKRRKKRGLPNTILKELN